MSTDPAVQSAVQQYIDSVAESLTNMTAEQRSVLLREVRDHVHEAICARASGRPPTLRDAYATLAEMDLPETYADTSMPEAEERKPDTRLTALLVLCSGMQMAGFGAAVSGVPVIDTIGGFAAIVGFLLRWSIERPPRRFFWLSGAAAICGLGTIIIAVARGI